MNQGPLTNWLFTLVAGTKGDQTKIKFFFGEQMKNQSIDPRQRGKKEGAPPEENPATTPQGIENQKGDKAYLDKN
jgi:hypothetical protein